MSQKVTENKQFLRDLFTKRASRHGLVVDCVWPNPPKVGYATDFNLPIAEVAPFHEDFYSYKIKQTQMVGDDSVPVVPLWSHTGFFAEAFGCKIHVYDPVTNPTNPCALPRYQRVEDVEKAPQPKLSDGRCINRFFELGHYLRKQLGPEAILTVPDIQSPFDIAALVWEKQDYLIAMHETPEAVHSLVEKCRVLLTDFLKTFIRELGPAISLAHCPASAWAPPDLGLWLSEDEVGAISPTMFREFCLPVLTRLSEDFGGMFMHCCASADHQYENFNKIPNLRGLNRVYQAPGVEPAIKAFSGRTVLIHAWLTVDEIKRHLALAQPDTRFLFNIPATEVTEAQRIVAELRPLLEI